MDRKAEIQRLLQIVKDNKKGRGNIRDLTSIINAVYEKNEDYQLDSETRLIRLGVPLCKVSDRNKKWKLEARRYFVYVFKYKDKIYRRNMLYIGITTNINKRLNAHKKEKDYNLEVQSMFELSEPVLYAEAEIYEDELTIAYMFKYGYKNVRGGKFCQKDNLEVYDKLRSYGLVSLRQMRLEGEKYINSVSIW